MFFFHVPSLVGLAFLIQSVRCRTKSKKKSPSGTEMTLSAILTNKENPSAERRLSRWPIEAQKSLARVEESTSKASSVSSGKYTWNIKLKFRLWRYFAQLQSIRTAYLEILCRHTTYCPGLPSTRFTLWNICVVLCWMASTSTWCGGYFRCPCRRVFCSLWNFTK